jgi:hypothetical protein
MSSRLLTGWHFSARTRGVFVGKGEAVGFVIEIAGSGLVAVACALCGLLFAGGYQEQDGQHGNA